MKFIYCSLFLILIEMFGIVYSDIPVHCLKSQIQGKWKIFATELTKTNKEDLYKFTCKHQMPSNENSAYLVQPDSSFKKIIFAELSMDSKSIIEINNQKIKGNWTMVYNEGFDILADDYSFFSFSKYSLAGEKYGKKQWKSKCYSTLVGFYHKGNNFLGCFYAEKIGENPNQITNDNIKNKLHVVEGVVKAQSKMKFMEERIFDNINFLQTNEKETLVLDMNFKDHAKVVERINSMKDSLWEAANYEEYANLTIEDLNNLAGKKKHNFKSMFSEKKRKRSKNKMKSNLIMTGINNSNNSNIEKDPTYPEFPKNYFDDIKHMNKARNQGNCGSCYAIAALNMIEARLSKNFNIKEKLSVQHILSCSVYNQGCNGGYPYLALKFGKENELVPESCMMYSKRIGKCKDKCDIKKLKTTYKVTEYYYLGGSYGKCTEYLIMKELYKNGPLAISFEPDYTFMMYRKGIYNSPKKSWINLKVSTKPEWQKVDHSVTVVGWGYDEEKKTKYWLLQNSWGEKWGEGGYFKMLRGTDHLGIESYCEAGMVTPIHN